MHPNAEIAYRSNKAQQFIGVLQAIPAILVSRDTLEIPVSEQNGGDSSQRQSEAQPLSTGRASARSAVALTQAQRQDLEVARLCRDLLEETPEDIGDKAASRTLFKVLDNGLLHCFTTVLLQEQERFNTLLAEIRRSLQLLAHAIEGLEVMGSTLDTMYACLLRKEVPPNWKQVAYSSNQHLAAWFSDLGERIRFMRKWMAQGHPPAFWLGSFFFPHGFLTAVLQTHARKHKLAVDSLSFGFGFLPELRTASGLADVEIEDPPQDGVVVFGLFLEQAAWDSATSTLVEQPPGKPFSPMAPLHLKPQQTQKPAASVRTSPKRESSVARGQKLGGDEMSFGIQDMHGITTNQGPSMESHPDRSS